MLDKARPMFPHSWDSTMLASFQSCPQKCFRTYLEHWKPKAESVHLVAGGAFARGVEVARKAFYEQGWAQENLGAFDSAVELYQRVISLTDVEIAARAQFMIGEVQFAQKDYKEAIKSYFKVMYGYSFPTWQAEATFEAARCFEVLKKVDQALDLYRELVERFPESSRVALAKERIEKLAS